MEAVSQWAYTLCMGAILMAVLQGILPVKSMSAVIKLVLSLYILLLLLSPVEQAGTQWDGLTDYALPDESTVQVDPTDAVLRQTEQQLEDLMKTQLATDGLSADDVVVSCSQQGGQVDVERVTLYLPGEPDPVRVEASLRQALGYLPPYEILQTDGTTNETGTEKVG